MCGKRASVVVSESPHFLLDSIETTVGNAGRSLKSFSFCFVFVFFLSGNGPLPLGKPLSGDVGWGPLFLSFTRRRQSGARVLT